MSLQIRLALASFFVTAVAVGVLTVGAYLVARDRIFASIDERLNGQADAIGASISLPDQSLSQDDVDTSRRSLDAQVALGTQFRLLDIGGEILYSPTGRQVDESGGLDNAGYRTTELGGDSTRFLTTPILLAGQPVGYVEIWTSLEQTNASLGEIRNALAIGGGAVSVAAAFLAFLISRRAVQPVRQLAVLADEVEQTSDFSRRLPVTPSSSEMKTMASTFNRMISRVERMLASQRSFLSDTSHELRRPLAVIRTNLDVLSEPGLREPERSLVLQETQEVIEAMGKLLTELLALSRGDEDLLLVRPIDFSALCTQSVRQVSQIFPQYDYPSAIESDIWLEADSERLARAVDNLLQNAAIYSSGQGAISIQLERTNGQAVLVIADAGVGMDADEVDHAFDRFYRGSGSRRVRPDGLGLGLAIVKQAAERHGGSVSIESEIGHGTRVTMRLPQSYR